MGYQAGISRNEQRKEISSSLNTPEQLSNLVWHYHERDLKDKVLETLLLLGRSFPDSKETQVTLTSFYETNSYVNTR